MPFDFQLTDDQVALLGCLFAMGASFALMSLSFHANSQHKRDNEEGEVKSLPLPAGRSNERKAA